MKTVRILGFIIIVIIVVLASTDGFKGFKDGWNSVSDIPSDVNSVSLSIVPDKALVPDSIYNTELQRNVSYKMSGIETYVSYNNSVYNKSIFVSLPFVLFFIYGFYCLVRMLVDICRNQVLTRKNVRRMRFFVYSFMLLVAFMELVRYLEYIQMVNEIALPAGYSFDSFRLKSPWMLIMLLVLFVEIFAKAEKIKEENDLTI